MSASGTVPARRPSLLACLALLALPLVLLLSQTPAYQRLALALEDGLMRLAAPGTQPSGGTAQVLAVDIDDAALRTLRPRLGDWPYRRDLYALLLDYLREAGVRLLVFDIVFSGSREGDAALARALQARPDWVLAAAALSQDLASDQAEAALLPQISLPAQAGPALRWSALNLPAPALLQVVASPGTVGLISVPLDADGRLRQLPLLHRVGERQLPALPLASLMRAQAQTRWQLDGDWLSVGALRWQLDAAGRVRLPLRPEQVQRLDFAELVEAALGARDDGALRERLRGRLLFLGSSAFFADAVMTPQGQVSGSALMAAAHTALAAQQQWRSLPLPAGLGLWALALLPALWSALQARPRLLPQALVALAALALLGLGADLALRGLYLPELLGPLLLLLLGLVATALGQLRWTQRANEQLAHQRAVAEAANRAKSEFLANVSHEIRTPMNALLGMAELLAKTELNTEQRRYVDLFRSSGQSLFELINDLLDISKIEAGRLDLEPCVFELRALVDDCLALLRERAQAQGLWLRLEFAPEAAGWVQGDPKRLAQVLLNLLGNAIKFTREGGITLSVWREAGQGKAPGLLRLTVADTGIGIAPGKHELIFQPFTQADGSVTRYFGGTGLGLSISRSLTQMMGGRIWVESAPGQGARFHLAMPLPAATAPPAEPLAAAAPVSALPLPPQTLLLCEDNEVNVMVIEAMLAEQGHRIEVASNGLFGVEMFRRQSYDLVLMDVQMPGMDGHSATRELRRIEAEEGRPRTPVIALTAHAFASDAQASLAAGCDDHLSKPVSQAALLQLLQRWGRRGPPRPPPPAASLPAPAAGPLARAALAALPPQRLAHAQVFLAAWRHSWALASADLAQARQLAQDLGRLAEELGADELRRAALALAEADPGSPARLQAQQAVERALAPVLLALG